MTLIMLEAAGRICHKVISPLRLLTACSVGGLSSLVMTIDSRGYFTAVVIVMIKLSCTALTVLIAFDIMIALHGWKNCRNGDKKRSALPKWESGYAYLISN